MRPMNAWPEHPTPRAEPPAGLWTSWSRREVLGLFFMLLLGNFFFQIVAYRAAGGMAWPLACGALLGVVLPVVLLARVRGLSLRRDFFLDRPPLMTLLASALLAFTTLAPTSLLAELSLRLTPADPEAVARLQEELPSGGWEIALALLAVVLLGPLAEEILFRGLLHRLAASVWGPWSAAAVSSLIFAILHGQAWIIFGLIGVGLALAFVFQATGSVTACWVTHAVHNGISLGLMIRQGVPSLEPAPITPTDWLWGAGSLLAALLVMRYLLARRPVPAGGSPRP